MTHLTKQPVIICAGLLGLTLAVTGCSTTNHNDSNNMNGKSMMHHGGMKDHHDKMGDFHQDYKSGMGRHMDNLNLTDAQKAQIEQLHIQDRTKMQQLQATLAQYDANIAAQKQAGATTETLLGLYQQKQAVMDQAFAMHKQEKQQFLNILTPDQQLKLYESQDRPRMPPKPMLQNNQALRPN